MKGTKWYKPLSCVGRTPKTMMQVMISCKDVFIRRRACPQFLVASGWGGRCLARVEYMMVFYDPIPKTSEISHTV